MADDASVTPPPPSPPSATTISTTTTTTAAPPPPLPPSSDPEPDPPLPVVEQQRLHLREVFVYAVPRLATTKGYRAEDLNLPNPLLTGYLKAFQRGDAELFLRVYQPDHVLFAECPISLLPDKKIKNPLDSFFIPVVDSSRYFVIKVVDKNRHAFIAIGFRERSDAFDLKALLEDMVSYNARVELANCRTREMDERVRRGSVGEGEGEGEGEGGGGEDGAGGGGGGEGGLLPQLLADLRLKEGEKLKLDLTHALGRHSDGEGGAEEKKRERATSKVGETGSIVSPLLPPPPPAGSRNTSTPAPPSPLLQNQQSDDEWSDFVG